MTRGPLTLAALASAAVPELDPVSVEPVLGAATARYDVAFVQDAQHRRWVIRCPRSGAASAQLEQAAALTQLLARRLRLSVPVVKGWVALPEGGRAAVYPYLTGQVVDLASLQPGPGLTASLGRALATVHNLDPAIYDEAGAPSYDAEAYRTRRLADLDRAAATGRVPTGLLTRWETQLEDVGRWRFAPVPTLGGLVGERVVVTEVESGDLEVKGFLGWEDAQVADPADDLAEIVGALGEESLDTLLEAYAHTRVERPDAHLLERARLGHEMRLVRQMMASVAAGDLESAEEIAADLRRLDDEVADQEQTDEAATSAARGGTPPGTGSTAVGASGNASDDEVHEGDPSDEPSEPRGADDGAGRGEDAEPAHADDASGDEPRDDAGDPDEIQPGEGDADEADASVDEAHADVDEADAADAADDGPDAPTSPTR